MFKTSTQSILLQPFFSIGIGIALLTLIAMPSRAELSTIAPLPKLLESPKPNPPLPAYLETLRAAARLEGRALGVAAVPSQLYQAFEQAIQSGKTIRPEIERLLHESTPAGRIYAAMLLVKLDPKAGRQLLEQMKSDQTALIEASGCEISQISVGAAVDDILQGRSGVFPPLP